MKSLHVFIDAARFSVRYQYEYHVVNFRRRRHE